MAGHRERQPQPQLPWGCAVVVAVSHRRVKAEAEVEAELKIATPASHLKLLAFPTALVLLVMIIVVGLILVPTAPECMPGAALGFWNPAPSTRRSARSEACVVLNALHALCQDTCIAVARRLARLC